jgi:hypothetical protein
MRTAWLFWGCVLGLLTYQGSAAAQAAAEYGTAAGAGAAAAAGAKGAGASIGAAFDGVSKALKQGQGQDQAPKAEPAMKARPAGAASAKPKTEAIKEIEAPAAAVSPAAPAPQPSYEDAMGIQKGISCEELVRRFGPPAMAFATGDDAKTMSYASKAGGVQVECQGGKVASVDKPH